ncbi:MAG: hypothetical protein ACRD6X_10110, partial [Pyrinomonadaceae bacterium]
KSLQGDLDNIILKALRKEPERRYASVQEFSEDIRRHLAGLPVTATADTVSYRFKKFAARHRGGVFAGGLVLLTLLVATGVTSWQAYVARQERDKAELRFNQVRKLANTILFDYHDGIAELAGSTPVREKMVKDSLEYLDNLANESSGDADLQRELAAAYRKVGDIQGSYGGTNIGNTGAAFESYQKALSIQTKLVEANPANIEDRRMQARLMIDIAHQYENAGDFQSSESNTRKATEIFNGIVNEQPNETKSRSDLARALWTLASAVRAKGDLDGAITQYDQAARIYEKLAEEKSDERKFSRNAALTYKNIGGVIELKKDYSAALEYYRKALIIDMKNAEEEPENATSQLDLSFSYGSIASASMNLGNLEEALDYRNKALSIQEKIAAADAKNVFAKAALARTFRQLGDLHEKRIKFDEALSNYRKSLQIFESLSNSDPKNSNLKAQFGDICSIFGNFLLRQSRNPHKRLERLREAQTFQKRGFEIFQTLKSQNALEKRYDEQFGEVQNGLKQTESELAKIRQ